MLIFGIYWVRIVRRLASSEFSSRCGGMSTDEVNGRVHGNGDELEFFDVITPADSHYMIVARGG